MRAFAAVPVAAVVVCLATPAFADASAHVTAAKKAEHKGDWRKALKEWKAAYAAEPNAEYLIGIGDALARLGNKPEAKKNYEAYLNDPLALPANVDVVKKKLAQLDAPAEGTLALPAAAPPALMLPSPEPAKAAKKADAPLQLPGIDSPATPTKTASNDKPLALPGLELPAAGAAGAAKKEPEKVASASPPLPLPLPGASTAAATPPKKAAKKETSPAVAKEPAEPPQAIAMVTPAPEKQAAPMAAVTATAVPGATAQSRSGGVQRTMAYVTAAVAVVALGGGAVAFTQANSAHDELTSKVHTGADAQRLLGDEQRNKTLSFVGFAGGLVLAGVSTALFAF